MSGGYTLLTGLLRDDARQQDSHTAFRTILRAVEPVSVMIQAIYPKITVTEPCVANYPST